MKKITCHLCETLNGLIVFRSGETLCPRCYSKLIELNMALPKQVRNQIVFTKTIDINLPLDSIVGHLMANFVHNGMSISRIARQLGITRSTVYATLRRNNLIRKDSEDRIRLNPTVSDFAQSGGYD